MGLHGNKDSREIYDEHQLININVVIGPRRRQDRTLPVEFLVHHTPSFKTYKTYRFGSPNSLLPYQYREKK